MAVWVVYGAVRSVGMLFSSITEPYIVIISLVLSSTANTRTRTQAAPSTLPNPQPLLALLTYYSKFHVKYILPLPVSNVRALQLIFLCKLYIRRLCKPLLQCGK